MATSAFTQGRLEGRVVDHDTRSAVPFASVTTDSGGGTATNSDGDFSMEYGSLTGATRISVSCIGYSTRSLSLDSLRQLPGKILITLKPVVLTLPEIVIGDRKIDGRELARQAIEAIPLNYLQEPFNMEYYSNLTVNDSAGSRVYQQETIVKSYRSGYMEGAINHSIIVEQRVTGTNPVPAFDKKRNVEYFVFEGNPRFDVFLADLIGTGKMLNYSVFNPGFFKRLEFRKNGTALFERDTVVIIDYDLKNFRSEEEKGIAGKLFISTRNLAILKHERKIGKLYLDVIYRPYGQQYFPYFIRTTRPERKVGTRFLLNIEHEAYIQKIIRENVTVISNTSIMNGWHLSDVPYRKDFWQAFRPTKQ